MDEPDAVAIYEALQSTCGVHTGPGNLERPLTLGTEDDGRRIYKILL